ncbi:hypothetical protein BKA56DRAFT_601418 [Ilyonectria sp. MPI-CAGE-AT-0026]|nr:hypothetical protein BKA56DRAFT_601418 [Ilyonectria sp. MPI-CAGE-AT-0026]
MIPGPTMPVSEWKVPVVHTQLWNVPDSELRRGKGLDPTCTGCRSVQDSPLSGSCALHLEDQGTFDGPPPESLYTSTTHQSFNRVRNTEQRRQRNEIRNSDILSPNIDHNHPSPDPMEQQSPAASSSHALSKSESLEDNSLSSLPEFLGALGTTENERSTLLTLFSTAEKEGEPHTSQDLGELPRKKRRSQAQPEQSVQTQPGQGSGDEFETWVWNCFDQLYDGK